MSKNTAVLKEEVPNVKIEETSDQFYLREIKEGHKFIKFLREEAEKQKKEMELKKALSNLSIIADIPDQTELYAYDNIEIEEYDE
jgi:hypothetical protein